MWRVKGLADPDGVLAPGVLLNRDEGAHLRNLKTTPEIEEVANTCVECGFCEPVCPSRHLTTTPRQRIVIRREMARQPQGSPVQRALIEQYEYDGIQTCAADGTCQIACPLGIDTGQADQGIPRRGAHREGAAAGSAGRRALVVGREDGSRGTSRRDGRGPADARRRQCRPFAVQRRARPVLAAQHATARPGEAAANLARGRRRRLHARVRQPDLRAAADDGDQGCRCSRRWWPCRPGPECRSGSPTTSPASAARSPGRRRATRRARS